MLLETLLTGDKIKQVASLTRASVLEKRLLPLDDYCSIILRQMITIQSQLRAAQKLDLGANFHKRSLEKTIFREEERISTLFTVFIFPIWKLSSRRWGHSFFTAFSQCDEMDNMRKTFGATLNHWLLYLLDDVKQKISSSYEVLVFIISFLCCRLFLPILTTLELFPGYVNCWLLSSQ